MPDKYQNKVYLKNSKRLKHHDQKLLSLISKNFNKKKKFEFLDVGCASGNLIYRLKKIYINSYFTGIDVHKKSILKAKKKMKSSKNCSFKKKNLLKFKTKKKFNIIIASGLLSFFENFEEPLNILLKLLENKKQNKLFIFGRFNSSDIDTKIKFRNNQFNSKWRNGFSSYSIQTVSKFLAKKGYSCTFSKFHLPINIKKTNDLTRSYTILTKTNKRIILNKANIIAEFYFLIIKHK